MCLEGMDLVLLGYLCSCTLSAVSQHDGRSAPSSWLKHSWGEVEWLWITYLIQECPVSSGMVHNGGLFPMDVVLVSVYVLWNNR